MTAGEICTRNVVVTHADETVVDAAKRMRMFHVGALVVVDRSNDHRRPIGLLTDRDIVLSVVASDPAHLHCTLVRDVMTSDPITISESEDILQVLKKMQVHGVRRLPVINETGELAGVVAFDDVARSLADGLNAMVSVLASEHVREERYRA
jgi:CBS domain-containing protein